jgi:hypothetical protein
MFKYFEVLHFPILKIEVEKFKDDNVKHVSHFNTNEKAKALASKLDGGRSK